MKVAPLLFAVMGLLLPAMPPAFAQSNPWQSSIQAAVSASARTLTNADCGTNIPFTSSSTVVVTAPATIQLGCNITVTQLGTGTVKVVPAPGSTLPSPFNGTSALGNSMTLSVVANAGGSAATWIVSGQVAGFFSPGGGPVAPTLPPAAPAPTATYYVSTTGSDAANGTSASTPWATIAKVNAASFAANSAILFNGGQSWVGCLAFIQGGNVVSSNATSGIQLGAYGTGKATITSNCAGTGTGTQGPKSAVIKFDGVNGVFVSNIIASCNNNGTQYGILVQNSINTSGITNVTISGNQATGCQISTAATGDWSSEISVLGYTTGATCSSVNQILISNNVVGGTLVSSTDDDGINLYGCTANSTLVSGSPLNITNATVINNTVTNMGGRGSGVFGGGSGNGILVNGVAYANLAYNTVSYGGYNTRTCGGPGGIWTYNADNVAIQFNEVHHMQPSGIPQGIAGTCDWVAYDLDGGTTNSAIQYNHSYSNWGPAWLFYMATGGTARGVWGPNVIRYNISENDAALANSSNTNAGTLYTTGVLYFGGSGASPSIASAYNNQIFMNGATTNASCISFVALPTKGLVANNICDIPGQINSVFINGSGLSMAGTTFINNNYHNQNASANPTFSAASAPTNINGVSTWGATVAGGEVGSNQVAPGYSVAPSPGVCTVTANVGPQSCPSNYQLGAGAAGKGAGANLTAGGVDQTIGATDYYRNVIPNSTSSGENFGPYGGN